MSRDNLDENSRDNQSLKWNAMLTLANRARVDREFKIDALLDRYLEMIADAAAMAGAPDDYVEGLRKRPCA